MDAGELSQGEADLSRYRHVLTNALGGSEEEVHVDMDLFPLEDGDRLMLCSDGLTDGVDDDTIAAALGAAQPSADVAQKLLQCALDAGGRDNITVIVATFRL
jgi:protein phosphatase